MVYSFGTCDRPGCNNPVYKEGVCQYHYDLLYSQICSRCGARAIILTYGNLCQDCYNEQQRHEYESRGVCPACGGTGWLSRIDGPMVMCSRCGGSGKD